MLIVDSDSSCEEIVGQGGWVIYDIFGYNKLNTETVSQLFQIYIFISIRRDMFFY